MPDFQFDTQLIDCLPEAISIVDIDGTILFLNKRFIDVFGYQVKEISTLEEWGKLAYPDKEYRDLAFSSWKEKIDLAIKTKETQSSEILSIKCKSGETKVFEVTVEVKDNLLLNIFKDITEDVKAERNILNQKHFTTSLLKNLPGIFYMYEKNGSSFNLLNWNDYMEEYTGFTPNELQGKNLLDFIPEPNIKEVSDKLDMVMKGNHEEAIIPLLKKDKTSNPFLCIGDLIKYNDKEYLIGQGIDISKQLESEGNFKIIFDAFPDSIVISDYSRNILLCNPAFEKLTGYTIEYLNDNKETLKLQPDEDQIILSENVEKLINSNQSATGIIENRFITKSGGVLWFSGIIAKIQFNKKPALLIISRDITIRKRTEKAFAMSESRMSTVFDSAPVIMMLVNEKREILQINKKGLNSLKLKPSDKNFTSFGNVYKCINALDSKQGCETGRNCTNCLIKETIKNTFQKGKDHVKVPVIIKSINKDYHILLSTCLLNSDGPKEVLLTIDDITEQKKIEEDLKKSREKAIESDKLKSAFLQNMSHEIRTPLNGILGFAGLLANDSISSEDREYYIDVINQSSQQLLVIVDDILNISRLETGQIEVLNEEVNVNLLLHELFVTYKQRYSDRQLILSHNKELGDTESIIYSDREKLKQVLIGLLNNALKFTHEGHVLMGYSLKENFLEFYVEDTGIGIDPKYHDKIFERFQQVDFDSTRIYGGTGLGLTIAKGNIELLGGKIGLESTPEVGSRFFFTIPYKPVHEAPSIELKEIPTKSVNNATLLVAEDEEINFLFIAEALRELDYNLIHAKNGQEAVNLFNSNSNINLVLLDIKMPIMNGYEAIKEIHSINPDMPVIAQTAYAMASDKTKALAAGFIDYLAKPIKKDELIHSIQSHILNK